MKFQVFVIFLLIALIPAAYAENSELSENSSLISERKTSTTSNIHSILIQWQESENPEEFAKNHNLSYKDGKVGVYIYLDNAESQSKIPLEIEITASDDKIAVAFVTSEQLYKLSEMEFVERISLPVLAQNPPIPKVDTPETQPPVEEQPNYFVWLVIWGAAIFIIAVILKKQRRK